jgi:hypothetical protein
MGNDCLRSNDKLTTASLPVLTTMGNDCLRSNDKLTTASLPVLTTMGNDCLRYNDKLTTASLPVLTTMGNDCLRYNDKLTTASLPVLTTMGNDCLRSNDKLTTASLGKNKLNTKSVDGFCFIVENEKTTKGIKIYTGYNLVNINNSIIKKQHCFVAEKENFYAHGETVKKAIGDLQFKIVAEKLKKDPINKDTKFTVKYYRLLTGACDLGVRSWMTSNKIAFKIEGDNTVELKPIKAVDLLPLLEKSNAYGIDRIKSLITF